MTKGEFDRLIQEYQGIIWKVCRSFAKNEEDQKDLFQEILFNLWKGKDTFTGDSKISTWIYRVSFNRAIDYSRKKRIKTTELKESSIPSPNNRKGSYDIEALYLAISKLTPINRAIIILYLDKHSYKEIGEIVGLSEKNVSVKLVRIKKRLKKYYLNITKIRNYEH